MWIFHRILIQQLLNFFQKCALSNNFGSYKHMVYIVTGGNFHAARRKFRRVCTPGHSPPQTSSWGHQRAGAPQTFLTWKLALFDKNASRMHFLSKVLNLKTCHYNQCSTQRTAMISSAYIVQANSYREIYQNLIFRIALPSLMGVPMAKNSCKNPRLAPPNCWWGCPAPPGTPACPSLMAHLWGKTRKNEQYRIYLFDKNGMIYDL